MKTPNRANLYRSKAWFQVLQTTKRTQTAVMTLGPGQSSGDQPEAHRKSEQTLLLVEGELQGEVEARRFRLKAGDIVIIPAGQKHRFTNRGQEPAITFNTYCPPEYSPGQKG